MRRLRRTLPAFTENETPESILDKKVQARLELEALIRLKERENNQQALLREFNIPETWVLSTIRFTARCRSVEKDILVPLDAMITGKERGTKEQSIESLVDKFVSASVEIDNLLKIYEALHKRIGYDVSEKTKLFEMKTRLEKSRERWNQYLQNNPELAREAREIEERMINALILRSSDKLKQ